MSNESFFNYASLTTNVIVITFGIPIFYITFRQLRQHTFGNVKGPSIPKAIQYSAMGAQIGFLIKCILEIFVSLSKLLPYFLQFSNNTIFMVFQTSAEVSSYAFEHIPHIFIYMFFTFTIYYVFKDSSIYSLSQCTIIQLVVLFSIETSLMVLITFPLFFLQFDKSSLSKSQKDINRWLYLSFSVGLSVVDIIISMYLIQIFVSRLFQLILTQKSSMYSYNARMKKLQQTMTPQMKIFSQQRDLSNDFLLKPQQLQTLSPPQTRTPTQNSSNTNNTTNIHIPEIEVEMAHNHNNYNYNHNYNYNSKNNHSDGINIQIKRPKTSNLTTLAAHQGASSDPRGISKALEIQNLMIEPSATGSLNTIDFSIGTPSSANSPSHDHNYNDILNDSMPSINTSKAKSITAPIKSLIEWSQSTFSENNFNMKLLNDRQIRMIATISRFTVLCSLALIVESCAAIVTVIFVYDNNLKNNKIYQVFLLFSHGFAVVMNMSCVLLNFRFSKKHYYKICYRFDFCCQHCCLFISNKIVGDGDDDDDNHDDHNDQDSSDSNGNGHNIDHQDMAYRHLDD